MAEDNDKKNLEEAKLTNEKLGELTNAINESAEDAAFRAAEMAAEQGELLGSEEEQQETKKAAEVEAAQRAQTNETLLEIQKNGQKASKDSKGIGGMLGGALGKVGGALGGSIAGIGLGVGASLAGAAQLMTAFNELDGKKVKENVKELLSIGDEVGGNAEALKDGGSLFAALTGLGIGLGVFAAGSAAAAGAATFTKDSNFAETIKTQLQGLLSISDSLGGNWEMLKDGGALTLALGGLGVGLAFFGVGSAIAGMSDGIKTLTGTQNFADNIKKQVITLLGIKDELGGNWKMLKSGGAFALSMAGIGAGLAVFGAGAAVAGLTTALADFSTGGFADSIVNNVKTLLSLADDPALKSDTKIFLTSMTGIAGGLAVFGIGGAIAGLGTALANFLDPAWASSIVANVVELLSISDLVGGKEEFLKEGGTFFLAMTGIGAGLAAFGTGSGIGAFISGVGKLFGGESPMDKILKLADNVDALKAIGPAFKDAAAGINNFGSDIKGFDKDSKGIKEFFSFLDELMGVGMARDKTKALNALAKLKDVTMSVDGNTGDFQLVQGNPNKQGAQMAALQNDTLERIAAATEAQLAIVQGGGGQTINNVAQTQVNQTNLPDRDLTASMYTPQPAM